MTRVVRLPGLRKLRLDTPEGQALHDNLSSHVASVNDALDQLRPRPIVVDVDVSKGSRTPRVQLHVGETAVLDGGNLTSCTLLAPKGPQKGDAFSVKNASSVTTSWTVDGNGLDIEGYGPTYTKSSEVTISGAGVCVTWFFTGNYWACESVGSQAASSTGGSGAIHLVASPKHVSGTVEGVVASAYLTAGTYTSALALMGSRDSSQTATLYLRSFTSSNTLLQLTRTGLLASSASTGSVVIPADGWYDVSLKNSAATHGAVCTGFKIIP